MKRIYLLIISLILLIPNIIKANEIYNINMDIYIDNNGTAHVTEEWSTYLNQGTEGYKPYYNIGTSSISNFKVKLNNIEYTFKDNYNTNASFEDKKYTNGFNYINKAIELCFGISEYGYNTYYLSYDISNFVVNTSDNYQMIYWTLFPYDYNPSPGNVNIKIYSIFKYDNTLDVWGYGKKGVPTYVYDGYIEMSSSGTVSKDEYLTILVKFPSNTFNLSTTLDKTFSEYLEMANKGAEIYNKFSSLEVIIINLILVILFSITIIFVVVVVVVALIINNRRNGYGYINNKKINKKEVPYYRDIPCNKDIYYANILVSLNKRNFTSYKETNIFGAIILKWIKEGKIRFIKNNKNNSIDLTLKPTFDNTLEKELFYVMYKASIDGILETKELEKWCKNNYTKFFGIFKRINSNELKKLNNDNHIYQIIDKNICKYRNVMDDTLYEESVKLYGLKKFLDDFSSISTKEVLEVHLWDEYLMYAYIFGIADKTIKELKKLYPEVIAEVYGDNIDFDTLAFIHHISTRSVYSASSARARANSYSSGGGGYSSGGGGGGSFGGGGGGGGFR